MKFIIDFKNDASSLDIDSYLSTNGCTVVKTYSAFDKVYLVDSESQPAIDPIVESIIDDTANHIDLLTSMTWSTTSMDDWWKIASAAKPNLDATTISYEKSVVPAIVYMVDSGIQLSHPEFIGTRVSNLFSFNSDFTDYNGHGTALSSVIVGNTCGIVDAEVKAVKIFQSGTATLLSDMLNALDAIATDGALNPTKAKVINMSWSIAKNSYVENKIQQLIDNGFVVVTSAGNDGSPIENVTPASMEDAITVGAYSEDFVPCDFSNYTGYLPTTQGLVNYGALDVWAPGQNIRVASLDDGFNSTAGTSIAAAIHSAAVAFNTQFLQLSDGSLISKYQNKYALVSFSAGHQGLISLTGDYASSVNKVSYLSTEKSGENGFNLVLPERITFSKKPGLSFEGAYVIGKFHASSYEMLNLPAGLQFDNGILLGDIIVQEPTVFESTLRYVDYSGNTNDVPVRFITYTEDEALNNALKEELGINLTISFNCSNTNCSGYCDYPSYCFAGCEPKVLNCTCWTPSQQCQ